MGNYKKIDKDDILYIKNTIQDDERVLVGENINEEYSHDELGGAQSYPDVVVKATSAEEISEIMKYAYENNIFIHGLILFLINLQMLHSRYYLLVKRINILHYYLCRKKKILYQNDIHFVNFHSNQVQIY